MQSCEIKKGGNCNLIDCNAIAQKREVTALQSIKLELPPFLKMFTIALQSIKFELPPFLNFVWLHCNLLNWSYLPFIFCVIALQSINWFYLPFLFCAIALQSIKLELPPFYILCDCNLLGFFLHICIRRLFH
jgi:hypothetical protein